MPVLRIEPCLYKSKQVNMVSCSVHVSGTFKTTDLDGEVEVALTWIMSEPM